MASWAGRGKGPWQRVRSPRVEVRGLFPGYGLPPSAAETDLDFCGLLLPWQCRGQGGWRCPQPRAMGSRSTEPSRASMLR